MPEKTKVMYFTSKFLNSTSKPFKKLSFGDKELDYVDEYKYLGLTIDTRLSFAQHIKNTLKILSLRVMQLRKIRSSFTQKIALQLYKSMILHIIDYADIFYHNKSTKLVNKFQVIQNRCVRLVNTDVETSNLGLIPIANRRALHILQFARELTFTQPELLESLVANLGQGTQTRSHDPSRSQFKLFKPNKVLIEKSISYMLRNKWNALPTPAHE